MVIKISICIQCGHTLTEGMKFCAACGHSVVHDQTKSCTKCGENLDGGILFCKSCGTKQYISEPYKRNGALLAAIPGCQLYKMKLFKYNGVLNIFDTNISLDADAPVNSVRYGYQEITAVMQHTTFLDPICLKLVLKNGKSTVIALPTDEADFVPYLVNMTADLIRQSYQT